MGTFNSNLLKVCDRNEPINILKSDSEFKKWYLQYHDFTMFTENDVRELMDEEKPKRYPCIPVFSEDGFDVTYVGLDYIEHWSKVLFNKNT